MFSFHKPKIYRSNLGCCICKAKSSSSRFTDSNKYENEFERCFRIQEKRTGEICNACVLLVKRWKKLSPENKLTKHWHHVVDARAGPGTKLTGNRRLIGSSSHGSGGQDSSSNAASYRSSSQHQQSHQQQHHQQRASGKSDVLPLSSSQANNQSSTGSSSTSTATKTRTNSFSNKARAIDTNVSTFTFGEPHRRSYMSIEPSYSTASSYSSLAKPQSALSSSAFESVIKRFRQRQQQEQIEAQRRSQIRLLRAQQQNQSSSQRRANNSPRVSKSLSNQSDPPTAETETEEVITKQLQGLQRDSLAEKEPIRVPTKRIKHSSESIGSLTIDGLRVSTLLDSTLWRKEKVCCGIIFRGLCNEVVVFPKLLKPCQCRLNSSKIGELSVSNQEGVTQDGEADEDEPMKEPPPRAAKSGSISSCDSNTSGTGSMEQPLEESHRPINETKGSSSSKKTTSSVKRPRSISANRRMHTGALHKSMMDTDSNSSSSGASLHHLGGSKASVHSPGSVSSGSSASRSMMIGDGGDEEDAERLILEDEEEEEEEVGESSEDAASSSVESLTEVEVAGKKSGALAMG